MPPRPYEVYDAAVRWERCSDLRPVVVIENAGEEDVAVALVSGQMDCYNPSTHFKIDADHPDFAATGLRKTCYVAGHPIVRLSLTNFLCRRGELTGSLAAAFARWI